MDIVYIIKEFSVTFFNNSILKKYFIFYNRKYKPASNPTQLNPTISAIRQDSVSQTLNNSWVGLLEYKVRPYLT